MRAANITEQGRENQNAYEHLRESVSTKVHTVAQGEIDILFIPQGLKLIQSSFSRSHGWEVPGMNWLWMAGQRILRTFF